MYQRSGFRQRRWLLVVPDDVKESSLKPQVLGDAVRELEVDERRQRPCTSMPIRNSSINVCSVRDLTGRISTVWPQRDRHVFSSLMLAHGHGRWSWSTGATRKSAHVLDRINHVFDADAAHGAAGVTALLHKGRIVLMGDTLVHEWPDENDLANIAERVSSRCPSYGTGAACCIRQLLDLWLPGLGTCGKNACRPRSSGWARRRLSNTKAR